MQTTGSLFFGNFDWPHEPSDAPVTKPLIFTNSGAHRVTLNLAITGTGPFTLGADLGDRARRRHRERSGHRRPDRAPATAASPATSSAPTPPPATRSPVPRLALIKEEERYDLKIKLIDRDGKPANAFVVLKKSDDFWPYILNVAR